MATRRIGAGVSIGRHSRKEEMVMMNGMMDGGSMMWGMGLIGLLVILVLVLGVGALVKYLFFDKRR